MTDEISGNDTRFQPGQSGNPAGRPKGSRALRFKALDDLADEAAEDIAKAVIEKAKGGDIMAASRVFERVWPPRKGTPIAFDLPPIDKAEDLPAAIASVTRQVSTGDLTPDEGTLIVSLLEAQRRAIETGDHAQRLTALEERAGKK